MIRYPSFMVSSPIEGRTVLINPHPTTPAYIIKSNCSSKGLAGLAFEFLTVQHKAQESSPEPLDASKSNQKRKVSDEKVKVFN